METRVYVSGALCGVSNLDELRAFYESIARVCREAHMVPYVPHLVTDPVRNADLSPREVYELDREQVANSDLVIACVGIPSFGVGMEVEIARQHGIPVILLSERGKPLSRMARGNRAVIAEVPYADFQEALAGLADLLGKLTAGSRPRIGPGVRVAAGPSPDYVSRLPIGEG